MAWRVDIELREFLPATFSRFDSHRYSIIARNPIARACLRQYAATAGVRQSQTPRGEGNQTRERHGPGVTYRVMRK
jgi:hypothetical protein